MGNNVPIKDGQAYEYSPALLFNVNSNNPDTVKTYPAKALVKVFSPSDAMPQHEYRSACRQLMIADSWNGTNLEQAR